MPATIKSVSGDTVTLEVTVKLSGSMLDSEQAILNSMNEAGSLATGEALKRFDTDGSRLEIGGEK